jgi:microsomal dipeptidase-like Zn-dependent dipeptidase
VAELNGLIGIAMFEKADCGSDAAATAAAIKYAVDVAGISHVALGSDFDGAIKCHFDITGLPMIVDELMKLGFNDDDIRMVMSENSKRFLLENLPL